jgi:YD repeat-containing protein
LISYDTDGRAERIVGTNIDVTERRRTEAAVKEGQTRLAAALAAGRVMAFEWDAATRLVHRSDNAIVVLGNDHAGSTGDPCDEDFLGHVHTDDQPRFRKTLRGLNPESSSYALSFRYVRADGQHYG